MTVVKIKESYYLDSFKSASDDYAWYSLLNWLAPSSPHHLPLHFYWWGFFGKGRSLGEVKSRLGVY